MSFAADRGGPFYPRTAHSHRLAARAGNWMRAAPPGIARRRDWVESSPVGGDAAKGSRRTTTRWWIVALLAALGVAFTGHALYIHAKAQLAQALLHRAWIATQHTGRPSKPWPWADTTPVARLLAPAQQADLLVRAGANGRTLAFGPGHHDGSALPGEPGNAIFSAHRDTHFRFLRAIAIGDPLVVEMPAGRRYERTLTLVTCWPFDAVEPGGPLRYVVVATADAGSL
jgi:sortase A